MSKIKSAFAEAFAWLERAWRANSSTAGLAFFIAFALVFALGPR